MKNIANKIKKDWKFFLAVRNINSFNSTYDFIYFESIRQSI